MRTRRCDSVVSLLKIKDTKKYWKASLILHVFHLNYIYSIYNIYISISGRTCAYKHFHHLTFTIFFFSSLFYEYLYTHESQYNYILYFVFSMSYNIALSYNFFTFFFLFFTIFNHSYYSTITILIHCIFLIIVSPHWFFSFIFVHYNCFSLRVCGKFCKCPLILFHTHFLTANFFLFSC